ncbi:MAG: NUDIX domain-containing protein [Candidatus Pristimantibacillus lignocellulolyticus]|uniref:NUDIX domain-containing protein n=1 Tax=Candidatus Pristimantibacillus lignocellulolyticus TaxID=2994561 RepID=A0A9J6ZGD4_9BACL|nr:MAG: NUDIX domain-containing protein [Candidatus Pristimantibacillus lignocellulolyticus]
MSSTEWFDIYDEQLRSLGRATRSETHTNGYWHRTFHCWIYEQRDNEIYIAFQQRQVGKDTNPLCYDITVAGHLTAGEQLQDAVREIAEEVGLLVKFKDLHHMMQVREEAAGEVHGKQYIDREISDVFALQSPRPLSTWKFQVEEVLAVYEAPLTGLRRLFLGQIEQLEVSGYIQSQTSVLPSLQAHTTVIMKDQFVPRPHQYYLQVFDTIEAIK